MQPKPKVSKIGFYFKTFKFVTLKKIINLLIKHAYLQPLQQLHQNHKGLCGLWKP